jgi:hypothetical protein
MSHENREFVIINVSEISKINFNEVLETSSETLRMSKDKNKTFFKWEGNPPEFLTDLTTNEGPYTYTQMVNILNTEEWSGAETP